MTWPKMLALSLVLTERQRLAETLRDLAAHSEQRATITTTVGATA